MNITAASARNVVWILKQDDHETAAHRGRRLPLLAEMFWHLGIRLFMKWITRDAKRAKATLPAFHDAISLDL
jgi:hypothetical protein